MDVEYFDCINLIQCKYILDLVVVLEIVVILLVFLNKGGGEKKGGLEVFFINLVENFLVVIIYFFVNFYLVGFKNGKKLKCYVFLVLDFEVVIFEGNKLELVIWNWDDYYVFDVKGNIILDFVDKNGNDVLMDEDWMFVDLNGFLYLDWMGK